MPPESNKRESGSNVPHRPITALITLAILAVTAAAHAVEIERFAVGEWRGAAFSQLDEGTFSHCAIYASHDDYVLGFFKGTGETWNIDLRRTDWSLPRPGPGVAVPLTLQVDTQTPHDTKGLVVGINQTRITLPSGEALIAAIRGGRELYAIVDGKIFAFSLKGSNAALGAIADCVARNRDHRPKAFATPADGQQQRAAHFADAVLQEMDGQEALLLDKEAWGPGFAHYAAVWRRNGVTGGVQEVPTGAARHFGHVAEGVAAADRGRCSGDYDAYEVDPPADDGPPAIRFYSTCFQTDRPSFFALYQILGLQDGTHFVIGHRVTEGAERARRAAEADADFRAALMRAFPPPGGGE